MPDISCATWDTKEDKAMAEEWDRTQAGNPVQIDPKMMKKIEQKMPEVERTIEEKIEKIIEARVKKCLKGNLGKEFLKELVTPEKFKSLATREYNRWRGELKEAIIALLYKDEIKLDKKSGTRILGEVKPGFYVARVGEIIRETIMYTLIFYKQSLKQLTGTLIHEHAEVDYKLMPEELKEQFEKEIWPTTDKKRELEFFKGEFYGASSGKGNPHVFRDPNNNYAFWLTTMRLYDEELESHERMQELKEINPVKFEFCKERWREDEGETILEKLQKGELIRF